MRALCIAVLVGVVLCVESVFAQSATSIAGQSIWHHEKANGSRVRPEAMRTEVRAGRAIRRIDILILDFGLACEYSDPVNASYAHEEAQSYYQPGYQWGAGLRQNNLAWADFLPYLEQYLLIATPNAQGAFRRGFVEGFGGNGEATYDYAFRQAARPG